MDSYLMGCRSSISKQGFISYVCTQITSKVSYVLLRAWIFRPQWTSKKGSIPNTIVQCPLAKQ